MSFSSKAYFTAVMCAGCALLAYGFATFRTDDVYRFTWFLILALLASGMKVRLPSGTGTLSVLFLFLFIAILQLRMPETLVIGVAATFVQSYLRAEKPQLIHLSFNLASIAIATSVTYWTYQLFDRFHADGLSLLRLSSSVIVFFVANTLIVSVIIALTENKPIAETWRKGSFWLFPYYVGGGCVAGLFSFATRFAGWQISFLVLPVVYFTYRSYRLYLDRLDESQLHASDLRAAADQLNAVLESTTDCVLALDKECRIKYANQRALSRFFGDSEAVGKTLWEEFPSLADGGFKDRIGKTIQQKSISETEEFFSELNAWFEIHAYPSNGGTALYLKEVTKQRELVEQLEQARKMEAVGRLAGGVAHDFNNLLTIILGYGQLVAELLDEEDPARKTIMEVLHAGERAAALTGRLLAFSRKDVQHPEVLDLNELISGMESMVNRLLGDDVHMSFKLDNSMGKVYADRNQIEQVIMNLAANAREAMPSGGEFEISTRGIVVGDSTGDTIGDFVVLSVSDSGCGMDASTKAKIFEPFFTTRERGKGTGLGLSVVYGIVQQTRGHITVDSEVGHGTTVHIRLPCASEAEPPTDIPVLVPARSRAGNILLVEDEPGVRSLVVRILSDAGYNVISPDEGTDALVLPKAELDQIDLMITDVMMPDISGFDLAAHLTKRNSGLRVLYISGHTGQPVVSNGAMLNGNHLLEKPFTRSQLLVKVQQSMELPACAEDTSLLVNAANM